MASKTKKPTTEKKVEVPEKESIPLEKVENDSIIVAPESLHDIHLEAKRIDSQMKLAAMQLKPLKERLEDFHGVHGILVDSTGTILSTFKTQNKKKGDCFDFDAFIAEHPDLWQKYQKKEKLMRVFLLK